MFETVVAVDTPAESRCLVPLRAGPFGGVWMHDRLQVRAVVELVLASLFALATALTAVSAEWIEELFGWSPDGGNGSFEWLIVIALGLATVIVGALGVKDLRRVRRPST